MSKKDPESGRIKAENQDECLPKPDASSAPLPVSSPPSEALSSPNSSSAPPLAAAGDNRTFSQLLAGAMSSPAGSPRVAPMLAVPVDAVHLPVMAVPCFLAPASLLESPRFTGQFAMTHQAVLATVTAQAQMQLQAAYPCSSEALSNSLPQPTSICPAPLQQRPSSGTDGIMSMLEPVQLPPTLSDQKSHSTQSNMKTTSNDGYNWRKYGQKQVKSSDRSRSYYKCTSVNCYAKKKVERCPDGRETEIIYRGQHNHDPPQKTRCLKEKAVQSGVPTGENEPLDHPGGEVNESDPLTSKVEQKSGNETPEQQLFCSSDCEGDAAIKNGEEHANEPEPKRRHNETLSLAPYSAPVLKTIKEPKIVVQSACDTTRISDGYRWRKYGQKLVKGNPNPRSYYRCTNNGCPVRKHVERASDDAKAILITYEGKHNHDQPAIKSSNDQPSTDLIAAAAPTMSATKDQQSPTSDSLVDKTPPTPTDVESAGDKALGLGGEKALESAQTLLSIGLDSSSGEEASGTAFDGINRTLFSEGCAAVPVQNS